MLEKLQHIRSSPASVSAAGDKRLSQQRFAVYPLARRRAARGVVRARVGPIGRMRAAITPERSVSSPNRTIHGTGWRGAVKRSRIRAADVLIVLDEA